MTDDSPEPIDQDLIKKNLELARKVISKLESFGVQRQKIIGRMAADLSDLVIAGEELARDLEAFLASTTPDNAMGAIVSFEVELEHMSWHMKSARKDIAWLCEFLEKTDEG